MTNGTPNPEPARVRERLREVLLHAAGLLFPRASPETIEQLVKTHRWRNSKYVGEAAGRVLAWSGYSINLSHLDCAGKTIYGDHVCCPLPSEERRQLFGEQFAAAIEALPEFILLFNCDVPVVHTKLIQERGFVPRPLGRRCHICVVSGCEDFLAAPIGTVGSRVAAIVQLQQTLLAADDAS
jgi:hypothetical protein